jgi:hypothetical protein
MINIKSIVTLGIGFGALAIVGLGIPASTQSVTPVSPPKEYISKGGGGGGTPKPDYLTHNRSINIYKDVPISISIKMLGNKYEKIYVINPVPDNIDIVISDIIKNNYKISIEYL